MRISGQKILDIKSRSPELWRGYFGKMHYRNNFSQRDGVVYFGTCGDSWNIADSRDAVFALRPRGKEIIWERKANADVNHTSATEKYVFFGTDGNEFVALDRLTGEPKASVETESPVANEIHTLPDVDDTVFTTTISGEVIFFDREALRFNTLHHLSLEGAVTCSAFSSRDLYLGTDAGIIYHCDVQTGEFQPIFQLPEKKKEHYTLRSLAVTNITVVADRLVVSYSRETYDEAPPLLCLNRHTGRIVWTGGEASPDADDEFGNAPAKPLILGNRIYCTFAYNSNLTEFSLDSGDLLRSVRLDNSWFQNWASPIEANGRIIVPRVSGVLVQIDPSKLSIEWVNSVEGQARFKITANEKEDEWPDVEAKDPGPYPAEPLEKGIASTPTIADGLLIVGTVSGHLICLDI